MKKRQGIASLMGPDALKSFGFWAVLSGALAVVLVFVQIGGPMLEPEPSAASQLGEMAGEFARSAWRGFLGQADPQPIVEEVSLWRYLAIVAPILGVIAICLSMISGIKRENWHYPAYGASLGAAAIIFQYIWWVVLLVAGILLLLAIIEFAGGFFSI